MNYFGEKYYSRTIYFEFRVMKMLVKIIDEIEENLETFEQEFEVKDMEEAIEIVTKELEFNRVSCIEYQYSLTKLVYGIEKGLET